jgi:hypothetical protein
LVAFSGTDFYKPSGSRWRVFLQKAAAAKIAEAINRPGGNVIHFAKTGEASA